MQSLALGLASATEDKDIAFWNSVYKENHVVQIHISANREAWDAMQPKKVERNPNGPKVHFGNKFGYAKANITIDGELFKDAGLRFKGNSSYRFAGRSLKKPFKIDSKTPEELSKKILVQEHKYYPKIIKQILNV